jgi:hypothetical protein
MRRPIHLCTAFAFLATLSTGCAMAYKSSYRETNHDLHPQPVAAAKVKVVKSRDELTRTWTELGSYKGNAPTVREAMDAAKQMCGQYGADLFILNVPPFASEGVFKIDGICAASTRATAKS